MLQTQWKVGAHPVGVTFTLMGEKAYVANKDSQDVSVIDTTTNTVIDTVEVGKNPVGIAANSGKSIRDDLWRTVMSQ